MVTGRSSEIPLWVGVAMTAGVLAAVLFSAAVVAHLAVPVWVGWVVAGFVVVMVLVTGYALAVRSQ